MSLRAIITVGVALAAFWPSTVRGHTPSETHLTLFITPTNVAGQWDVAMLDLQQGLRMEPAAFTALAPDEHQRRLKPLPIAIVTGLEVRPDGPALQSTVRAPERVP